MSWCIKYSWGAKVMRYCVCNETTVSNHPVVHPKSCCDVHIFRGPWIEPIQNLNFRHGGRSKNIVGGGYLVLWEDHFKILCFLFCFASKKLRTFMRGHSTTTWTKFWQILTPSPLEWIIVDILHDTYPLSRDQAF